MKPIYERQEALNREFSAKRQRYQDAVEKDGGRKKQGGHTRVKANRPELKHAFTEDATVEAVAALLQANPHGIALICDELSAFLRSLNAYRNGYGADREFYSLVWSGLPAKIDRKTTDSYGFPVSWYIPRPFLNIIGGIQPDVLHLLTETTRGKAAGHDGFLDRFLFLWPEARPLSRPSGIPISEASAEELSKLFNTLWKLSGCQTSSRVIPLTKPEPVVGPRGIPLSESGRIAWNECESRYFDQMSKPIPEWWPGPAGKLRSYRARLALVISFVRAASQGGIPSEVSGDDIRDADKLIEYFALNANKVWRFLNADADVKKAAAIMDWIRRHGKEGITLAE